MPTIRCANPSCCATKDVRQADIDRGWGKFCSKSCKAIEQTRAQNGHRGLRRVRPLPTAFVRSPAPQPAHGLSVPPGGYVNRADMIDAYDAAYVHYHVPAPLNEERY